MADQQQPSSKRENRKIVKRLSITGTLKLLTPTHLGNGEPADVADLMLIRDEITGKPLLTGTTLAGALRNYLREWLHGYASSSFPQDPLLTLLFGDEHDDHRPSSPSSHSASSSDELSSKQGQQSYLIVDDALGQNEAIEIRDGVAITPKKGVAEEGKKYDIELLSEGTTFPLHFELLIPEGKEEQLKQALAMALHGLERGEIMLGTRKRRGFGRCRVERWSLTSYDLTTPDDLIAWLEEDERGSQEGEEIAQLLGVTIPKEDQRCRFTLRATFQLKSPLLIRSAEDGAEMNADFAHLRSNRNGKRVPVLPGTSVAGALRHRALRILNTLSQNEKQTQELLRELFGDGASKKEEQDGASLRRKPQASRLIVHETVIQGGSSLVQTRIRIDRFTGGTYPGALFNEAPLIGNPTVEMKLEVRNPKDSEIGLLLLLLKDLWTGDLTLGGERSIGRGRLEGMKAEMKYRSPNTSWDVTICQKEKEGLLFKGRLDKDDLQKYLEALQYELAQQEGA